MQRASIAEDREDDRAPDGDTSLEQRGRTWRRWSRSVRQIRQCPVHANVYLLIAWSAVGAGAADNFSRFSNGTILLLVVGFALVCVVLARRPPSRSTLHSARLACGFAGIVGAVAALVLSRPRVGHGPWLVVSELLLTSAAVLAIWALVRSRFALVHLVVVAVGLSCVAMIRADPAPTIDVWHMLQAATQGLSHGRDIYTVPWRDPWTGRAFKGYAYLPGSAVLLWPFEVVFGDVRYGVVLAVVVTALLLGAVAARHGARFVGALAVLYPQLVFGVDRSWVDPLIVVTVVGAVLAAISGHRAWATLLFATCLACKQTSWLLVPMAAVWPAIGWRRTLVAAGGAGAFTLPWILVHPRAFYEHAFAYNLGIPARFNSESLYPLALAHHLSPGMGVVAGLTLIAIVFAMRRAPQDAFGFFVGSAAIMIAFDLVNKQTFYNEWFLAAGLLLGAVAFAGSSAEGATEGWRPPVAPRQLRMGSPSSWKRPASLDGHRSWRDPGVDLWLLRTRDRALQGSRKLSREGVRVPGRRPSAPS